MKFIYKGKYNGDPNSLPHGEHKPNCHAFKEFNDIKKFGIVMNVISIVFLILLFVIYFLRSGNFDFNLIGCLLAVLSLVPHEFLHAICFKDEVYMYENLKQGLLFVTGPETISKPRFIFMSLLPNIVFGFIPFLIFLVNPNLTILGTLGAFATSMGTGDYYNVFNCITQVPHGGRVYMYGIQSYWYLPGQ